MKQTISTVIPDHSPKTVLQLFQQAADTHGELMGVGFKGMMKKGLLWVVTQIRYEVVKKPEKNQSVQLITWPLPAARIGFERNCIIADEQGEPLIRGTSLWVVIDTATRRLANGIALYPQGDYCTERIFPDRARRIRDFEAEPVFTVTPGEEYIDRNGHVNNTHYAAFAMEALGSPEVTAFQIDYIHEVLAGQPLTLCTAGNLVKGISSDGTMMFACSVQK
ncbi:MAG: hypothetical protein IJ043_03920 [Clostridia bacterium]|nr:hypothetical protein [Clostridia bacterium]